MTFKFRVIWDDNAKPVADNKAKEFIAKEIDTFNFIKDLQGGCIEYENKKNLNLTFVGIHPAPEWAVNVRPFYGKHEVRVCNDSVINEVRIAVINEKLKPEEVVIVFEEEELTLDDMARLSKWPKGFCDLLAKQMRQIILRKKDNEM